MRAHARSSCANGKMSPSEMTPYNMKQHGQEIPPSPLAVAWIADEEAFPKPRFLVTIAEHGYKPVSIVPFLHNSLADWDIVPARQNRSG